MAPFIEDGEAARQELTPGIETDDLFVPWLLVRSGVKRVETTLQGAVAQGKYGPVVFPYDVLEAKARAFGVGAIGAQDAELPIMDEYRVADAVEDAQPFLPHLLHTVQVRLQILMDM